jgi:hypothetical protein
VSDDELWVHQESAAISADTHDVWRFAPEFLYASQVVPDTWICRQASQSPDESTIQIEDVYWRMTRDRLWITKYPDSPLNNLIDDAEDHLIPAITSSFLEAVPYLPSRVLWMFWQISAVNSDSDRWMLENFLSRDWPAEFGAVSVRPQLTVHLHNIAIQITVRNGSVQRAGGQQLESTIFDCFAWRGGAQSPGEMISELEHRTERLLSTVQVVRHLLANRS